MTTLTLSSDNPKQIDIKIDWIGRKLTMRHVGGDETQEFSFEDLWEGNIEELYPDNTAEDFFPDVHDNCADADDMVDIETARGHLSGLHGTLEEAYSMVSGALAELENVL